MYTCPAGRVPYAGYTENSYITHIINAQNSPHSHTKNTHHHAHSFVGKHNSIINLRFTTHHYHYQGHHHHHPSSYTLSHSFKSLHMPTTLNNNKQHLWTVQNERTGDNTNTQTLSLSPFFEHFILLSFQKRTIKGIDDDVLDDVVVIHSIHIHCHPFNNNNNKNNLYFLLSFISYRQ